MKIFIILLVISISQYAFSQSIHTSVPQRIDTSKKFLFYLHGRIVEEQGVHAKSPQYGDYEYLGILDTLKSYGFEVISEARPKDTDINLYAEKLAKQVDTLLKAGIPAEHITFLGASKGAALTIAASSKIKNEKMSFAIMGICGDDDFDYYYNSGYRLCGHVLSIYEASDVLGQSCERFFKVGYCVKSSKEVKITTGKEHGFLYKPYADWLKPFITWTLAIK